MFIFPQYVFVCSQARVKVHEQNRKEEKRKGKHVQERKGDNMGSYTCLNQNVVNNYIYGTLKCIITNLDNAFNSSAFLQSSILQFELS